MRFGLSMYFTAFWELSTCRQIGMGVGPIPWTAMLDYARYMELDWEQTEDLLYIVRKMDDAFLKHHRPKAGDGVPKPK